MQGRLVEINAKLAGNREAESTVRTRGRRTSCPGGLGAFEKGEVERAIGEVQLAIVRCNQPNVQLGEEEGHRSGGKSLSRRRPFSLSDIRVFLSESGVYYVAIHNPPIL